MNNQRRKVLDAAAHELAVIADTIENAQDEEQEYYDGMPESFQASDKGDASQDAIDLIEQALDNLQGVIETLGDLTH